MGATLSSVWNSFSLPYRVVIMASILMWLRLQMNRLGGMLVFAIYVSIKVAFRRLVLGKKLNPRWRMSDEIVAEVNRKAVTVMPYEDITGLLDVAARYSPQIYPVKPINTDRFSGIWISANDNFDSPNSITMLFLQGGGFCFVFPGMRQLSHELIRKMKEKHDIDLHILIVNYSLSPLSVFPTALHEVFSAYEFLTQKLSISPKKIVLGGDSAGGNLALATTALIKDKIDSTPKSQQQVLSLPASLVLISPWLRLLSNANSYKTNEKTDFLSVQGVVQFAHNYLQGRPLAPYNSPSLIETFSNFPPVQVFAGSCEIFIDDILDFVKRFRETNGTNKVQLIVREDMPHDYVLLKELFPTQATEGLEQMADYIFNSVRNPELFH